MTIQVYDVPLYSDSSYSYTIDLEDNAFEITIYYNIRLQRWMMDIDTAQGVSLIKSVKLVPYHQMCLNYRLPGLSGFFWLSPIGNSLEKFTTEPLNLYKWFEFSYVYDDGVEAP